LRLIGQIAGPASWQQVSWLINEQTVSETIQQKPTIVKREAAVFYPAKRAIVIGGGVGGLAAARVLSDYFGQVLVLERDKLTGDATPRGGVPQGKQPHGLLAGGLKALENLFPNFGGELMRAGAIPIDPGCEWLSEIPEQDAWPRIKLDWRTYAMSRPLIELTLRRRVLRIRNVEVRGGCRVLDFKSDSKTGAATGIRYQTADGHTETLESDFIVEASGNGSLTLEFLRTTGRALPEETSIGVYARYASAVFERRGIWGDYQVVFTFPNAPEQSRGGLILPAENNQHQVVLIGRGKEIPPIDGDEFLSYARTLPTPTVYNTIKNAKRLTEITPFNFTESRWRHFAQVPDFPPGLLPIGDAICRFNPVYGQGMTVAFREANLLFDLLRNSNEDPFPTLASTFLNEAEKLIAHPWAMSAIPDFIYPETTGERPADLEDRLNFQKGLARLVVHDPEVFKLLLEVRHLLKPLSALDDPSIVRRVNEELADASQVPVSLAS
jgi:2-polyprenyl-6-methoxyphenol hydroxylase-like FAD-dependent oxidoreductase